MIQQPRSSAASTRRAALGLAGAAALAACGPRGLAPGGAGQLDTHLLDAAFPALAQRARPGLFALGVMDLQTSKAWYWNIDRAFPLAGAFTAPLAVAALAELDAGRLALGEAVPFNALDLSPPPGPIDRGWPTPPENHNVSLPVSSLFTLALQQSDATAADVLTKRVGGPGAISAFLVQKSLGGVRLDRYQRELGVEMFGMPSFRPEWKDLAAFDQARDAVPASDRQTAMSAYIVDPRDTATVPAALGFLDLLNAGSLLSPPSTALLLDWMEMAQETPTGLRAGLPREVRLARVGGATASDLGFTPAMTELGIATYPKNRRYALAAFLAGSTATQEQQDRLFADAARLAVKAIG